MKPAGLAAFGSGVRPAGLSIVAPSRADSLIFILAVSSLVFNLTDLATTFVALGNGLSEGNSLLLGMSAALGLSVYGSMAILKLIFVAGSIAIAIVGMRSTNTTSRSLVLCYLFTSTVIFYAASLNNIVWIVH